MELLPSLIPIFMAAGWEPGRRVPVDPRVPEQHPAHKILKEYGGLHVGSSGPGIECASSDLGFVFYDDDSEYAPAWSALLGSRILIVAEIQIGNGWLFVDEGGRFFGGSLVDDAFYFVGNGFSEAAERLLTGLRGRPMLKPDQKQTDLYGETFSRTNPTIFQWQSRD